jgi:hypothetical protein
MSSISNARRVWGAGNDAARFHETVSVSAPIYDAATTCIRPSLRHPEPLLKLKAALYAERCSHARGACDRVLEMVDVVPIVLIRYISTP